MPARGAAPATSSRHAARDLLHAASAFDAPTRRASRGTVTAVVVGDGRFDPHRAELATAAFVAEAVRTGGLGVGRRPPG